MTDIYTQENGSKKKFLAPVLVILLCMVSLTAAGYAYSATVDNTGDDVIVDGITMDFSTDEPIFHVADLHIATHTTNGKAIWYSEHKAFNTSEVYTDAAIGNLTGYAGGYYVEMLKGSVSGYHAAAAREAIDFAPGTEDDQVAAGIYQIGTTQTLTITNKSGGNIDFTAKISTADTLVAGIVEVYVVIRDSADDSVLGIEKLSVAGATTIDVNQEDSATPVDYKVDVYIAVSDYYSQTLPAIPASAYNFVVSFETVAHVASP